jgi:hypothetical protein
VSREIFGPSRNSKTQPEHQRTKAIDWLCAGRDVKMEGNTPVLRELPASRYNLDTYFGRVRVRKLLCVGADSSIVWMSLIHGGNVWRMGGLW